MKSEKVLKKTDGMQMVEISDERGYVVSHEIQMMTDKGKVRAKRICKSIPDAEETWFHIIKGNRSKTALALLFVMVFLFSCSQDIVSPRVDISFEFDRGDTVCLVQGHRADSVVIFTGDQYSRDCQVKYFRDTTNLNYRYSPFEVGTTELSTGFIYPMEYCR